MIPAHWCVGAECARSPGLHHFRDGGNRMNQHVDHSACICQPAFDAQLGRRRFLQVTAGALAATAFAPWEAFAAKGKYEAMVLSCIDPRFQELVCKFTA